MFKQRRRHAQILLIAKGLVANSAKDANTARPLVDAGDIQALAFGRYRLRVEEAEAAEYLNAALVEAGYPRPTPTA